MSEVVHIVRRPGNDPVRDKMNKCKHYTGLMGPGMVEHKTCGAGVAYADVTVNGSYKYRHEGEENSKSPPYTSGRQMPCFREEAAIVGCPPCLKAEYPTREEAEAKTAKQREGWNNIGKARDAIVLSLGGPWKKGTPGAAGVINCPICGVPKGLSFTRAAYNGHIHARCLTKDCVSWME